MSTVGVNKGNVDDEGSDIFDGFDMNGIDSPANSSSGESSSYMLECDDCADELEDPQLNNGSALSTSEPIEIPRTLLHHYSTLYSREKMKAIGFASPGSSLPKEL